LAIYRIALLAFFTIYGSSSQAVEGNVEELEVTATIVKNEFSRKRVDRHRLTRQQVLSIAPVTVVDLLRNVPGVSVTQQGGKGGLTFISLRGGEPNFTVVMVDGVKVNDIINSRGGGYDFVGLDPLLIKSIDVYFGGLSSVYGSEALGGVVSITTLSEQYETQKITLEAGSDDQHAAALHIATPLGESAIANISAAYRDGGNTVQGDSLERSQFNLKLNSLAGTDVDWKLNFFHAEGDSSSFPEDSGGDQLAVIRETEKREFEQNNLAGFIGWSLNDWWRVDVSASHSVHDEELDNPGIAAGPGGTPTAVPALTSDSEYRNSRFNVTNTLTLSEKTSLGVGAEWSKEKGQFDSVIDFGGPFPANFKIERSIRAGFVELNHQLSDVLSVTGGMRRDDADGIEKTTYRFASRYYLVATETDFLLHYGEGFKLPSFFALGHPLVGNTALQPEFSKNASFSVEQMLLEDRLKLVATYFYNRFTNLVDFDPMLFINVNRSKVVARGQELKLTYLPNQQLQTSLYVTYSDYSADAGVTLRRRPDWTGGVALLWQSEENYYLDVRANYVDSFFDSSRLQVEPVKMAGYIKVDSTLGWQLSDEIGLKFIVNNVFNSGYEETVGFSNSGREFRLQLSVTL
jgi:vitamin B12 transporter